MCVKVIMKRFLYNKVFFIAVKYGEVCGLNKKIYILYKDILYRIRIVTERFSWFCFGLFCPFLG